MTVSNKGIKDYDFKCNEIFNYQTRSNFYSYYGNERLQAMKNQSEQAMKRDQLKYAKINIIFEDSKFSYYYVNGQEVEPNFNIN